MKLIDNLTHFANNTSIHGLVYIAKKSSSKAKRITWFVIFILSMIYAGTQIAEEAKCADLKVADAPEVQKQLAGNRLCNMTVGSKE